MIWLCQESLDPHRTSASSKCHREGHQLWSTLDCSLPFNSLLSIDAATTSPSALNSHRVKTIPPLFQFEVHICDTPIARYAAGYAPRRGLRPRAVQGERAHLLLSLSLWRVDGCWGRGGREGGGRAIGLWRLGDSKTWFTRALEDGWMGHDKSLYSSYWAATRGAPAGLCLSIPPIFFDPELSASLSEEL